MSDVTRDASGARRASVAVLRGSGARAVQVRVPAPAVAGSVGEQLGLATPQFADVELSPVVVRAKAGATASSEARWELLVPGANAEVLAGGGPDAVRVFFATAAGVLVDGSLLRVEEVQQADCAGSTFLYRVSLQGPRADQL